jgi:hypothetical protein
MAKDEQQIHIEERRSEPESLDTGPGVMVTRSSRQQDGEDDRTSHLLARYA